MTAEAREPERDLLLRGDPGAFAAFYDRHAPGMFAVARAMLRARSDAEDAVQETFLNLFQSRASFARAESPRAYAFASLRRAALRLHARRRDEPLPEDPGEPDRPRADGAGDDASLLERALARLATEQREVLALKFEGGLTFAEIGAAQGVPANTAASRYRYALQHLERLLGGQP
jgi:RNA polymerase sigma-70 factor (ECF subfamily)